jgi:hypothetical protein
MTGGWTIRQWAELGVRPDGEPMSAYEMAAYDPYPDCTCWAPDDAEPHDHDEDCPEHPGFDGCE